MTNDEITSIASEGAGVRQRLIQFASSEMFKRLFTDGMALVEETAARCPQQ